MVIYSLPDWDFPQHAGRSSTVLLSSQSWELPVQYGLFFCFFLLHWYIISGISLVMLSRQET